MRKRYVFYENYFYRNNTKTISSLTQFTVQVTCYVNPDDRFLVKMLKRGCSYSPIKNKLYQRERVREVKIYRSNNMPFQYDDAITHIQRVSNVITGFYFELLGDEKEEIFK